MTMQARLQAGAVPVPGSVWASPQRDIAHSFPDYVRKALLLTQAELSKGLGKLQEKDREALDLEELSELALKVGQFINGTVGASTYGNVKDLAEFTGVLDLPPVVGDIFVQQFFRVVISAYWKGARMAYAESDTPIGAKELAEVVEELGV